MRHLLLTIATLFAMLSIPATASAAQAMSWIVDAKTASALVDNGATLLDARGKFAYAKGHLDGAVRIEWSDFTYSKEATKGELLRSDERLAELLTQHGVQDDRPVIVVDDPKNGWGEAGRIVWMLRTLGHDKSAWVDGGIAAMKEAGKGTTLLPVKALPSSGVTIRRNSAYTADLAAVKSGVTSKDVQFIDTREQREYDGKTPYGEDRGGHLPEAKHIWFKDLLDERGYLKPKSEIRALLEKSGVKPDAPVVAYCTGGVRSGWFTGVLRHVGIDKAQNYAGSMWQWAAMPAEDYPLE